MAQTERKLPEVCEIDFVITDETVNRKGWRVIVAGIDHSGFDLNPVCIIQHNTWSVPVGKWKNLRIESNVFKGTVEFDKNDPEAVKLYWKYKDGFMSAVSLHIIPIEESDDPSVLLPGQKYATVTKSELLEISLVTIPGQKNAVKLCSPDGGDYKLALIETNSNNMSDKPKPNTEAENQELQDVKNQLALANKRNAETLVDLHIAKGTVQESEKESLVKLATSEYDTVKLMLESRKPIESAPEAKDKNKTETEGKKLAEEIQNSFSGKSSEKTQPNEREKWSYLDYFKNDPEALSEMAQKEPDKFKKLEAEYVESAKKEGLYL